MKKYLIIGAVLVVTIMAGGLLSHKSQPAPKASVNMPTYIALGDSVAAGVGLASASDSSACNRTNEAYPVQAARQLNYKIYNLACSSATLPNGVLGGQDVNKLLVTAQLQQALKLPRPRLISLTIGANDVGWTQLLTGCYTGVCGSAADTALVDQRLAVISDGLKQLLTELRQNYGSTVPPTVFMGYHQVFPPTAAGCTDLTGIDASEIAWGRQMQAKINQTLQAAVAGSEFARYAAPDFSGHELCTADSWVQGLSDEQPYHPTKAGQAAFAKALEGAVQ